jgi:hypothetical protein
LITATARRLKLCARAAAAVEDARDVAPLEEPQVHRHHVVDVDEVAALLAVAVAARADEELHLAFAVELLPGVQRHRGHPPLCASFGPVDVEIPQARDLRSSRKPLTYWSKRNFE